MEKNNTYRQIIIKDNSIVICLVLTAVLIVAGLILAKTTVLGEAGSLYADSIPPQVFRFKIETQSPQKRERLTAAADLKPEAQKPAELPSSMSPAQEAQKPAELPSPMSPAPEAQKPAELPSPMSPAPEAQKPVELPSPLSPAPEAVKAPPTIAIVQKEKTAAAVLPKVSHQPKVDSPATSKVSEHTAAATTAFLKTMRGGRHPRYASIVFECSGPIAYDAPRRVGEEIRLKIRDMMSGLRPYRKYRTFNSWVRLNGTGTDLDVTIGALPGLYKIADFLMEDPHRLVINLYDK